MKEFNLSDKIDENAYGNGIDLLDVQDVKEFIKRLKAFAKNRIDWKTGEDYYKFCEELNKLAGKKLTQ